MASDRDLLAEWAKLEPTRIRALASFGDLPTLYRIERAASAVYVTGLAEGYWPMADAEPLFLAVIEAIESRNWRWSLEYANLHYVAEVHQPRADGAAWHSTNKEAALLPAYLDALRSARP